MEKRPSDLFVEEYPWHGPTDVTRHSSEWVHLKHTHSVRLSREVTQYYNVYHNQGW